MEEKEIQQEFDLEKEYSDAELDSMSDEEFDKYYDAVMQQEDKSEPANEATTSEENNTGTQEEASADESNFEQPVTTQESEQNSNQEDEFSKVYKFKANGQEYSATIKDFVENLAPKAVDYTKKTQAIKDFLPYIDAMKSRNINPSNINLLIDLVSGDKDRAKGLIKNLVKQHGIDALDLEDDLSDDEENKKQPYVPIDYSVEAQANEFQKTIDEMKQNQAAFLQTVSVVDNLDNQSKDFLMNNPKVLSALQDDIQRGVYAQVLPVANQIALKDGFQRPVLDYYLQGVQYIQQQEVMSNQAKYMQSMQQQQTINTQKAKCAIPSQRVVNNPDASDAESAIWNMSDEEFEKFKLKP